MFKKAAIIPTGDELASGIIVDTDSPAVMAELLRLNGNAVILRAAPVTDSEEAIIGSIRAFAEDGCDLIVLIGGSGGGHRYSPTLGKDLPIHPWRRFCPEPVSVSCTEKTGICGAGC